MTESAFDGNGDRVEKLWDVCGKRYEYTDTASDGRTYLIFLHESVESQISWITRVS